MSAYSVLKICRQVDRDPLFRERILGDPAGAIAEFDLTDEERAAFLGGDVKRLHDLGAHGFLLSRLAVYGVVGLTPRDYALKLRGPAE
jgi:aromatic-ring opening dioxygenase LigAB LigA subunit